MPIFSSYEDFLNFGNQFLQPKTPSEIYLWPQRDDVCWTLIKDVYCEVDAPSTGSTGWFYCLGKKTLQKIESYFK